MEEDGGEGEEEEGRTWYLRRCRRRFFCLAGAGAQSNSSRWCPPVRFAGVLGGAPAEIFALGLG